MATEEKSLSNQLSMIEQEKEKHSETGKNQKDKGSKGLKFHRRHTKEGVSPFDQVEWTRSDAEIKTDTGSEVFKQTDIEVPRTWSQTALNIVASKYFHGQVGTPGRETSIRQLIARVADTITAWGTKDGYFRGKENAEIFHDELVHLLLTQKAAFNSPVWFNCGIEETPQCSACFINSVEDSMTSILDLAKTEGMLFKYGSGTGSNLSSLRSSRERLSTGGTASGPVSFMRGYDAFAGVIKSGGKTRRAAKMVILNIDHPDIEEFITCKVLEEKKAWALIDAGYDSSFDGDAYSSVFFQNANHTVRVPDSYMRAVEEDRKWQTRAVTSGDVMGEYKARNLMKLISQTAWECGDPGIQFDTTINDWHTCKASGRINASNPCSEYMFLDNSACNLASLNLVKFLDGDDNFDVEAFRYAVDILTTAMEIIVDNASYPREMIAENSHLYRPLGLGYANLGSLLMFNGMPYDSDEGRSYAAAITSIMTGQAYLSSAKIASEQGPFPRYDINRESMLGVIRKHRDAVSSIDPDTTPDYMLHAAQLVWQKALEVGKEHGFRNAQSTVLAPTGTIGLMMDCDTTGIEPELALVKFKRLSGGGTIKFVNNTVPHALRRLGYDDDQVKEIVAYIEDKSTIEGAPYLRAEHLPVFDCAFTSVNGSRSIHPMGHVRMMAAAQPFLSGAISKTVNLPKEITPEEIEEIYMEAWRLRLKAVAVYRDGCKRTQPLNAGKENKAAVEDYRSVRHRLPVERQAVTHKFEIGGHEGYITVGTYEDGNPGEIFLVMAKEGSAVSGLMDSFATGISIALQYGVPLKVLVNKFIHTRFEPSGWTKNRQIPHAKSVMDYIFRWLSSKFLTLEEQAEVGVINYVASDDGLSVPDDSVEISLVKNDDGNGHAFINQEDAPPCSICGMIMVRNGTCYKCMNCGTTEGCS
ncbi:MAG TPA: vitamin B12-dependent ribonucleotide reductase [Acidobacteriota bacterium]|nr:vitamin B12-dependent ribonucleotide reductase [Acidobacteriota bacterium]